MKTFTGCRSVKILLWSFTCAHRVESLTNTHPLRITQRRPWVAQCYLTTLSSSDMTLQWIWRRLCWASENSSGRIWSSRPCSNPRRFVQPYSSYSDCTMYMHTLNHECILAVHTFYNTATVFDNTNIQNRADA